MASSLNSYGLKDPLLNGIQHKKESGEVFHPLEVSERAYSSVRDQADLEQLRQMQGSHAPMRIRMERRAVQKVGHLPCITQRSNLALDVLTGRDETLDFTDLFGKPEDCERIRGMPHNIIERALGNL